MHYCEPSGAHWLGLGLDVGFSEIQFGGLHKSGSDLVNCTIELRLSPGGWQTQTQNLMNWF